MGLCIIFIDLSTQKYRADPINLYWTCFLFQIKILNYKLVYLVYRSLLHLICFLNNMGQVQKGKY
jgi:hypothetical protein